MHPEVAPETLCRLDKRSFKEDFSIKVPRQVSLAGDLKLHNIHEENFLCFADETDL